MWCLSGTHLRPSEAGVLHSAPSWGEGSSQDQSCPGSLPAFLEWLLGAGQEKAGGGELHVEKQV